MDQQDKQLKMDEIFEVRDMRIKEKFQIDDVYLNGWAKECGIYATGVYVSLCRHVNKVQECYPSMRKMAEELAISEKQVGRAIRILEEHRIIFKRRMGKKLNNRYTLLDKSQWTGSPITTDSQSDHIGTDSPIHSKDTHIRYTHSKDVATSKEVADNINPLIELFKPINPSYERLYANKTQRAAMKRLIEKFDKQKIEKILNTLSITNGMKFAPIITTPVELENKIGKLIAFIKQQRSDQKIKEFLR